MIRLTSLELRNFKNIREGNIVLSSWSTKRSLPGSDIIGIYGQNGSGKTSVIQALAVLKNISYGRDISRSAADCVFKKFGDEKAEDARICVKGVKFDEDSQSAVYEFSYTVAIAEAGSRIAETDKGPVITAEEITVKKFSGKESKRTLMAYNGGDDSWDYEIRPKTAWENIFAANGKIRTELVVEQRLALKNHSSLIFSNDFFTLLWKVCQQDDASGDDATRERQTTSVSFTN